MALGLTISVAFLIYFLGSRLQRYSCVEIVGSVPLGLCLFYPLLQLIPLPPLLIEAISPATYRLYEPLLGLDQTGAWIPLSLAPESTLQDFFRFAGYGLTYILTVQLLSHPPVLKKSCKIIVLFGGVFASWVVVKTTLLGAESSAPCINLFLLMCPLAYALFLYYKPVVQKDEGLRHNLILLFAEPSFHRHLFFCFSGGLMVVAVLSCQCRGTVLSLLLVSTVFLTLYVSKYSSDYSWLIVVCVAAFLIPVLRFDWSGWPLISTAILDESYHTFTDRLDVWSNSIEIIKQFPLFGAGLGSFAKIYPYIATVGDRFVIDHAQNDCLTRLVEVGSVGALLAVWFILTVLWHAWTRIRVHQDRFVVLIGIGVLSGITVFIVNTFGFMSLHNGGSGFYFFFFLGVLVATVNCRFEYYDTGTLLRPITNVSFFVFVTIALGLFCTSLMYHGGAWYCRSLLRGVEFVADDACLSTVQGELEKKALVEAVSMAPFDSDYSYRLGQLTTRTGQHSEGLQHLVNAGLKNVMDGKVYQLIGLLGANDGDFTTRFLEIGYRQAPRVEQLAQTLSRWYLNNGRRVEALNIVKERFHDNYRVIDTWMPLLIEYGVSTEELMDLLPPSVDAWLSFGKYAEAHLNRGDSDLYYEGALTLISEKAIIEPGWFYSIIEYYRRNNRPDMAALCIRRAVTLIPRVASFHRLLGDYYLQEGIVYRAKEEYGLALILDPEDMENRNRLQQLISAE